MRHSFLLILSAFLLPACTIQQENGNDLRLEAPPLIAGNHWHNTQQSVAKNGDRVCTVSAGEMDVTQRAQGKTVTLQVGVSYPLSPGDRYRVIMDNQIYETTEGWFSPADSQAIIHSFQNADIVYTEVQKRSIQPANGWQRTNNKIKLSGFSEAFKACERFVKTSQARE